MAAVAVDDLVVVRAVEASPVTAAVEVDVAVESRVAAIDLAEELPAVAVGAAEVEMAVEDLAVESPAEVSPGAPRRADCDPCLPDRQIPAM